MLPLGVIYVKIILNNIYSKGMVSLSTVTGAIHTLWNQIVFAVSNGDLFDVLDIAIIAWLIYKAIGFLRETRAGQLVKGIFVLIVVYAFANLFELAVLKWLLSAIVNAAIIVFAVIFQPELRRILERVGQTKLANARMLNSENEPMQKCIDKVCKAAGTMQENKIGALIVFERKTQLGEIINTGTVIDAEPSASIISNIFFPKSPLHDGAMIIRDGRVYAAGCILPLTQSQVFSSQLGTRHRAAIGMTENSDAVVLVVSEETGNISIVCNGQITRNFTGVSARTELQNLLVDSELKEKDNTIISALKHILPFENSKKNDGEEDKNED